MKKKISIIQLEKYLNSQTPQKHLLNALDKSSFQLGFLQCMFERLANGGISQDYAEKQIQEISEL
jgi:hypothetical protein